MSLAGLGVVAIWHDLVPEAKEDYYEWHNREHMPERVGTPGFRRGRRYIAISGAPEYFTLYEADSVEVLSGQDYNNRLNAPTEWTRRVLPHFRNVARSICRVAYTGGVGSGGVMLTMCFDVEATHRESALDGLTRAILPPLAYRHGVSGVHLLLADEAASKLETAEATARTYATRVPTWVVLIEGNSAADARTAGESLAPALTRHHASTSAIAVYRHEYTRLKTPWSAG
jgi:hypothetical protein